MMMTRIRLKTFTHDDNMDEPSRDETKHSTLVASSFTTVPYK